MSPTTPVTEQFAEDFHGPDGGRQERLRRLVQQSPKDRIADMSARVNQPSQCEYCGSTWFCELTFNQYSKDAYSASPGGDIQPISLMPMPIRVCLCGMPMAPNLGGANLGGRTPNESVGSFNGSLRAAAGKILSRDAAGTAGADAAMAAVQGVTVRLAAVEKVERNESLDPEVVLGLQKRITELEKAVVDVRKAAELAAQAVVPSAPGVVKPVRGRAAKVPDVPAPAVKE